ncbi:hypothetical protein OUZ56_005933 [Daphnia magna]|uniref:Uncharacterized protein n=1 Tax=Daphnia magna TaxID=35525 RepID=A0ABQ9YU60_9CRUS|nr:hypothetical protein OUZ56_005933 [Daphnia magna]
MTETKRPKFHQQVTQLATQVEQRLKWAVGANSSLPKVLNEFPELHNKCFHRLQSLSSLATALASVSSAILHCESFRMRTPEALAVDSTFIQFLRKRVEELHELNPIMQSQLAVHHQLISDVRSVLKSMAKCEMGDGSVSQYLEKHRQFSERCSSVVRRLTAKDYDFKKCLYDSL